MSEGSGRCNEDHWGFVGPVDDVRAAWVLDGVTGINARRLFDDESDARWLVMQAHRRLQALAAENMALDLLLHELVAGLEADVTEALGGEGFPEGHDPPATCLLLAKRYDDGWKALRLGDSCLLWRGRDGLSHLVPAPGLDGELAREAARRRAQGMTDVSALLAEFRPRLAASRQMRNRPGGYSVLEADMAALTLADSHDLGWPTSLLLCTDGYYRAVDHYGLHDAETLFAASAAAGPDAVLRQIREVEAADQACARFPRLKPADDATALVLV